MAETILYLGADDIAAAACAQALPEANTAVLRARRASEALAICRLSQVSVAVCDIEVGDKTALDVVQQLTDAGVSVVAYTADARMAKAAQRGGAWGVVRRQGADAADEIALVLRRAVEYHRLQREHASARRTLANLTQRCELPAALLSDDLVAAIGHDITNPLSALLGYAEILNEPELRKGDGDEIARRVGSLAQTTLDLVAGLLDALRAQSGSLVLMRAPVDFNLLVSAAVSAVEPHARQSDRRLVFRPAALLPTVLVDRPRMTRLLDNLLVAAVDGTPTGGLIDIATEAEGLRVALRVRVEAPRRQGAQKSETAPQLRGVFRRGRTALARALVEAQGGDLVVDDTGGSRLCMRLPLAAGRLAAAQ
ncbi:MAG: HAMP domain-containing histidine kinase [Deltaproteobacteria bacterium]|nr:HAMP domain-containing histidine kinase [Deltaproteobacteria bacterium]MBI3389137.1 HAMP domain-containing histidine kinase [Deltaproteobacteria bacterium]